MRYMGGKARQAKRIVASLPEANRFIEPFMGGASVTAEATKKYHTIIAADLNLSVVLFWAAVLVGWTPSLNMTKEEYNYLRDSDDSPEKAWAGIACSYSGKWFGGYGPTATGRDYVAESYRSTMNKADAMRSGYVSLSSGEYQELGQLGTYGDVIYCDPPYADSEVYSAVTGFDSVRFWHDAQQWAEAGARVFVSEFNAPSGWVEVDSWPRTATVSFTSSKTRTEKLYTWDYPSGRPGHTTLATTPKEKK